MSCDVGKASEGLENQLCAGEVTERLENEQSWFSNLSVTSPSSQLTLQTFRRFIYVTAHSPTLQLLHLRHSSFSNSSFAFPTSQVLHLIHLVSRLCSGPEFESRCRQGNNCGGQCRDFVGFFSGFFRLPIFIPPTFSTFNPPPHFIFLFIHFTSSFASFMVRKNTEYLKLMYTLFEMLFLINEMRWEYNCRFECSRRHWKSKAIRSSFFMSTAHSLTFPSLILRHNSFSNPSVASPTSQFILQPFFRFSYVTSSTLNSPGEPPMAWREKSQCTR